MERVRTCNRATPFKTLFQSTPNSRLPSAAKSKRGNTPERKDGEAREGAYFSVLSQNVMANRINVCVGLGGVNAARKKSGEGNSSQ